MKVLVLYKNLYFMYAIFLISMSLFKKSCLMGYCHNRSGISDSGIGMICNVFPETLRRLLLALCPNVTSSNRLLHPQLFQKSYSLGYVCSY
jgi:hypothetical protein